MAKSVYRKRREKLTAALRSGKYKKGISSLRQVSVYGIDEKKVTHCCLGVACDLYSKSTRKGHFTGNATQFNVFEDRSKDIRIEYADNFMPIKVMEYYGFKHNDPSIHFIKKMSDGAKYVGSLTLANLNDPKYLGDQRYSSKLVQNTGLTFEQMADVIDFFFPDENAVS